MSLITLNFDKNFIYVIIYWILEIIYRIIFYEREEFFKITKDIIHDEYLFVILLNIADLLSGFLVLYMKCSSKSKKKEDEKNEERKKSQSSLSELIYEKLETKIKKTFYKKLIIITVLDYISRSSIWLSYAITKVDPKKISHTLQINITITLDVIMRYIFSVFILKIIVFKHRIFSMITIGIGFSILIINDIILMFLTETSIKIYDIRSTFFYTAIASISGFSYPLEDTFVKQIFSEDYLYPANVQFDRGIFELILLVVITPILYFSFGGGLEFGYEDLIKVIIVLVIYTIAAFVKAYILLKIIYHYSSQSVSFLIISQSFGGSIIRFVQIVKKTINPSNGWKIVLIILEIFGIIIILFASLVYDEIIIINKWKLNENVKIGIINRGELEMKKLNNLNRIQADEEHFIDNDNNDIYSEDDAHDEHSEDGDNKEKE